jgi:hypothetical protein
VRLAMKPAAARDAKQQENKEGFQWTTLACGNKEPTTVWWSSISEARVERC